MLFNSYQFMFFFPVVLLVYFVIPKRLRYIWLLIASYYFYMGWNASYALLIATSTIITFFSGIALDFIARQEHYDNKDKRKKLVVAFSFVINLGILFFFKYFDFAWINAARIASLFGTDLGPRPLDVLLPVGISFYVFQALGYTVDVYRGTISAETNLLRYALFVSFFPQLVAGPIERSSNLLRQVDHVEDIDVWDFDRITDGAVLMIWGFFLKLVVADRVSILVDTVYNNFEAFGSLERIVATMLFALQIYCDFSSYSTIAVGTAKVMGFSLTENFVAPYLSRSVKEFWRRWHISLSTWFRDYLYFPLGGSRCSKAKTYRNIMIVFLVSGLWHGAGWSFLIWGALHGTYQVLGAIFEPARKKLLGALRIREDSLSHHLAQTLITFVLVDFAWVFFRMNSCRDAIRFIKGVFTAWNPWVLFDGTLYNLGLSVQEMHILLVAIVIIVFFDVIRVRTGKQIDAFLKDEMLWFRWGVLALLLVMIVVFGNYGPQFDAQAFIYFQF